MAAQTNGVLATEEPYSSTNNATFHPDSTTVETTLQKNGVLATDEPYSSTNNTTFHPDSTTVVTTLNYDVLHLNWNTWHTIHVIVLAIAIIGNFFTFCICIKKVNRKKSFMLYLAALAIFDTICSIHFLVPLLNYVPSFSWGPPEVYCKLTGFVFDSAKYISSWLIVAIALERTVSAKVPHHVARISGQSFGIKTIATIVVIAFILNSHLLYGWTGVTDGTVIWCYTIPGPYSILWNYFHPFILAIFYSLLPGTILILCNTVMVKAVFASTKIRGAISDQAARRNQDLMIVAILVSISFIILTSPHPLFLIFSGKTNYFERTDVDILIYNITRLMGYINNAINFFLYVISGSRFRKNFKEMIKCNACRRNWYYSRQNCCYSETSLIRTDLKVSRMSSYILLQCNACRRNWRYIVTHVTCVVRTDVTVYAWR